MAWRSRWQTVYGEFWKSEVSTQLKLRLFKALVETVYLYGMETYSLTKAMKQRLNGSQSLLLRKALQISYRDRVPNSQIYGDNGLWKASKIVRERRLRLTGHALRSSHPVADLIFWTADKKMKIGQGRRITFPKMLVQDTGLEVDDLARLAQDRQEWKQLIKSVISVDNVP